MEYLPIYQLRAFDVYSALETSADGLSVDDVAARLDLYGSNLLSAIPKPSPWQKVLRHISHPLALMLWVAGGLAFIVSEPVLGFVIWLLVIINAGFSLGREYRAEQAMEALQRVLPAYARVLRAGSEQQVPAVDIVPGDILVLAEGDNIPADARVIEEYGLRANNATLTGDAVPARKSADASLREGISELERPNLVFAGTSVVSGTGKAVVYATGMLTQFGRIAHLTQEVKEGPTPLQTELTRLTNNLFLVALGIGVLVFLVGMVDVGLELFEAFLLAMGILVAAVPEGLPATITLSLAMAGQRLASRGVLVKKLSVIETLGTVSTICTDKSGTLTQNQMTVREVWVSGYHLSVSGIGYEPVGEFTPAPAGKPFADDLRFLLEAATLCNNSRLTPPTAEHPLWSSLGDQTEAALRVAALKGQINEQELSQVYPRIHELPFDARRKRMTTIHQFQYRSTLNGSSRLMGKPPVSSPAFPEIAFMKGAPGEVLQLCTHILMNGDVKPLTNAIKQEILDMNDEYASRALRVLALAWRDLPVRSGAYTIDSVEHDMIFLGLTAMHDPPRAEVTNAIKTCLGAGIRIVMVTGDYGLTAESLARRVGMLVTPDPAIITGAELEKMPDSELKALLKGEVIFARMAPEHKLRLVAALQEYGEVVAVTGDGVNDAPALRKADIGVVMGVTGTDVAKEAADIILTNDNFANIVSAIEEGRAVYDNIRKSITYIFSSNVPEILPFILAALFKIPLALTVTQILAIDLGTDMLPAIGLGMEKPEPDVMTHPPRRRDRPVIDRGLLWRAFGWLGMIEAALCYSGFFLVYSLSANQDIPLLALLGFDFSEISRDNLYILAVTVFHAGVVMAQVGNAFACRTEANRGRSLGWLSNRFLWLGVGIEILLILALIYIPPLAQAFNHAPLPPVLWLWLIPYGVVVYSMDWIRKAIHRWLVRYRIAHIP